jgi:hypothetical protein
MLCKTYSEISSQTTPLSPHTRIHPMHSQIQSHTQNECFSTKWSLSYLLGDHLVVPSPKEKGN